jgi:predicted CoA-binding protein
MNTPDTITKLLQETHTIAVVGLSSDPNKPAHYVPAYLQDHGYRILPVNPNIEEALGETAYPDLASLPAAPDLVLIFRRSEAVPPIVDAAIARGAKAVWMQQGIVNEAAAATARAAGLPVVMDTCMMVAHRSRSSTP